MGFFKYLLISSLLLASSAFAQNKSDLNWKKALELLQKNNADYKSAELTYQSTEALETGARSGYFPSLSGSLGYTQAKTYGLDDYSAGYSGSLTLSQNLFAGLKDYYKTNQAEANTRVAQATFQESKAQISYEFVSIYQNLLSAQENLNVVTNIMKRRQDDLRLVELRYESGRENKGSVLLSQAYLAQAKYEVTLAEHALDLAQTTLAHYLGLESESEIQITDSVPVSEPKAAPRFQDLALSTPQYQEILSTVDANIASVGVARSAFFPTLSLTGTLGRTNTSFLPGNDRWSLAAAINIPIFDGGRDYSSLNSASLTRDSTTQKKISVDQVQIEALKTAHQEFVEAVEKMKVDEAFQKAATVRAEIARSQYNNGLVSFNDWDQIEDDLINRQKAYVISKKTRVLKEAAWKQALGEGVLP